MFIGSEEVKKELPNDAKRFEKVNASVMSILSEAVSTGNICDSCNKEGLSASLDTVATTSARVVVPPSVVPAQAVLATQLSPLVACFI